MQVNTIYDILLAYREHCPDKKDALCKKAENHWVKYSINDYIDIVESLATGLYSLELNANEHIVSITENRPEWNFIDMATARLGAIHVSVYTNINDEDTLYILNHSDAKIIFVSDEKNLAKIKRIYLRLNTIPLIFTFDEIKGAHNYDEIIALGVKRKAKYAKIIEKNYKKINANDTRSLIYTSGTTGLPKGVILSHENFLSNLRATKDLLPLNEHDKALSFLPISHILERMLNYLYQYKQISIYYAESVEKIADNLREIKPNGFVTVPRLIERIYDKLEQQAENLKGIKKIIYIKALKFAEEYPENGHFTNSLKRKKALFDRLIYRHWRNALGGKLKFIIVGGAALQPRLAKAFRMAGINLSEGYGLSETSPVVAVNHENFPNFRFGTVGPILENVKVKIAEDGEILVKGPNVMQGYYKDKSKTAEVFDEEGWFHTGDIGTIEDEKFLRITDRKKEIFKLSTGIYIMPQLIENTLKKSEYIDQTMVIGENEKFVSALIVPNFELLNKKSKEWALAFHNNSILIEHNKIKSIFDIEIRKMNLLLSKSQKIKKFILVPDTWSIETGELSPTLKLKRKIIRQKYRKEINTLYTNLQKN